LEDTGFTGADVQNGFALAARRLPITLIAYDNMLDRTKALANARDAIARRVDAYILYGWDAAISAEIGRLLGEASIPLLAVGQPVPGAPLYAADNAAAGRIAGEALARYAAANWAGRSVTPVILGPPAQRTSRLEERIAGITAGLQPVATAPLRLDNGGDPFKADAALRGVLTGRSGQKMLVATLDDASALAAKAAADATGRTSDVVIVGQGCDRSMHGNASERKELDPANRGSIVLGSVAFFLDRYGYDVLPLALALAMRQPVPPVTRTQHKLVTPANAFVVYPPIDIN
jgi:ABC-type sugar transport system substrate-binding protein